MKEYFARHKSSEQCAWCHVRGFFQNTCKPIAQQTPRSQLGLGRRYPRHIAPVPAWARRNMVAIMNEALQLEVGNKVLEVGAGSGWHAATVAEIVAPTGGSRSEWGHVYTIEIIEGLSEIAKKNIIKAGYADRVTIICRDGSIGYPEKSPYDRILVTAAAPDIPSPLLEQLKPGGIMVIPVGSAHLFQSLIRVRKGPSGGITKENLGGVAFVPLTGKYGHKI